MTGSENYYSRRGYKPIGKKICECCGIEMIIYLQRDLLRKRFCSRKCFGIVNCKENNLRPPIPKSTKVKEIKIICKKIKKNIIKKPPSHNREIFL